MRDYTVHRDDGTSVPVSEATNEEIALLLRELNDRLRLDGPPPEAARERLVLELQIREWGLR